MQTTACAQDKRGGPNGHSDRQDLTYGAPALVWREPERESAGPRGSAEIARQRRARLAETVNALHPQAKTRFAMRILDAPSGFQNRRARRLGRYYGLPIPSALLFALEPAVAAACPSCSLRSGCPREGMEYRDMTRAVAEGRSLGIRLFLAGGTGADRYGSELLDLALRWPDCTFVVFTEGSVDDALAGQAAAAGNLGFVLRDTSGGAPEGAALRLRETARMLREAGAPFGFVAGLSPATIDGVCDDSWLEGILDQGCLFGLFYPAAAPEQGRVLHFLNREVALLRQGSPMPMLNLQEDAVFTGEWPPAAGASIAAGNEPAEPAGPRAAAGNLRTRRPWNQRIGQRAGRLPLLVHPVTSRIRSLTLLESLESAWPAGVQAAAEISACPLLLDRGDTRAVLYAMLSR